MRIGLVALLTGLALSCAASAADRSSVVVAGRLAAEKLKPCELPGVDSKALCGRYEVFENRTAREGRKIGLDIVVLPATGPEVAADPLVFLAGGGVAPATRYAAFFAKAFPNLRRQRDVLLVDQRGTGGSNPLDCDLPTDPASPEYRDEARFVEAVRRCRRELEKKADLRFYSTPIAMDDLDEVRDWLGYSRLDLFGASYGTTAAMVYVRQHPASVRTVTLQGTIPLDATMWLEYPRSSQEALDRVFAACAAQPACRGAFPRLAADFDALLKRLASNPVTVKASPPEGGPEVPVTIDDEVLRVFVSRVLYGASRIHDLPLLIDLASRGDFSLLASRLASHEASEIPKGIYLSLVCGEQMQFDPSALPAAAAGTFLGGFRVGRDVRACREWVRGSLPPGFFAPVTSDVPALVMNGALDHATPPRYGAQVARSLSHARHLVLPGRGHNDIDPCICGMIEAFVLAGSPEDLDTSCLAKSEALSFALRREQLLD